MYEAKKGNVTNKDLWIPLLETTKVVFVTGLPLCHFVTSPLIKGRYKAVKLNNEPTAVVLLASLAQLKKVDKIQVNTIIFVFVGFAEQTKSKSELDVQKKPL